MVDDFKRLSFWAGAATDIDDDFSDLENNTLAGSISPPRRLVRLIVRAGLVLETVAVMGLVSAYFLL